MFSCWGVVGFFCFKALCGGQRIFFLKKKTSDPDSPKSPDPGSLKHRTDFFCYNLPFFGCGSFVNWSKLAKISNAKLTHLSLCLIDVYRYPLPVRCWICNSAVYSARTFSIGCMLFICQHRRNTADREYCIHHSWALADWAMTVKRTKWYRA